MDKDEDFTVTLISNGSEQYYPNNTLTQFTNHLPNELLLNKNKDWFVSIQDIGIHLNYQVLPFPKETPILITFDGNDVLSNLHKAKKEFIDLSSPSTSDLIQIPKLIYEKILSNQLPDFKVIKEELIINSQLITLDTLATAIKNFVATSEYVRDKLEFRISDNQFEFNPSEVLQRNYENSIKGLKEFVHENPKAKKVKIRQVLFKNSFKNPTNRPARPPTIGLCLHQFLFDAFDLSSSKTTLIEINKQPYYLIFLNLNEMIYGKYFIEKRFPRLASNICHINCDIIEPYNFNHNFCKVVRTISLPRSNTYLYTSLKSLQFFRVKSDIIRDISIRLTNDHFQNLPLLPGVASILKLKFKAMEKPKVSNIKVSSNSLSLSSFENKNNNFKIKIPSNLNFDQPNLKMCVSSITFPNKFKTLPSFYPSKIDIFGLNLSNLSIEIWKKISIPSGSYESNEDFLNILNGNIQEEISGINFSNSNQISVDPKYSKGHYCTLRSTKSVILALPTHVCLLLGIRRDLIRLNEKGEYIWSNDNFYDRMHISTKMKAKARNMDVDLSDIIKEKVGLEEEDVLKRSFFICLSPNDFYSFQHEMNMKEFRPKYFLLYNNICEHAIFDNKYLKILKIVPVKESDSEYITVEFENDEYVGIQISHPNYIEFALRTHTGELVEFNNPYENLIVDMTFKNNF